MKDNDKSLLQSKVFEFAFSELVRNHRTSFLPIWTVDSWVKFLIWMALNCGLSGDKESIALFIESLGSHLSRRMRRIFFERLCEEQNIHLMADPAELKVLLLPINPKESLTLINGEAALKNAGLIDKVLKDKSLWETHDGIISIPWNNVETCS